jgi:hypothetical protein
MVICKTVYIQTTHILFYVRSKRCILHVPSQEKFVQPFIKCYQIILLSLTCHMIDCTGQCESATAHWVNQTI